MSWAPSGTQGVVGTDAGTLFHLRWDPLTGGPLPLAHTAPSVGRTSVPIGHTAISDFSSGFVGEVSSVGRTAVFGSASGPGSNFVGGVSSIGGATPTAGFTGTAPGGVSGSIREVSFSSIGGATATALVSAPPPSVQQVAALGGSGLLATISSGEEAGGVLLWSANTGGGPLTRMVHPGKDRCNIYICIYVYMYLYLYICVCIYVYIGGGWSAALVGKYRRGATHEDGAPR